MQPALSSRLSACHASRHVAQKQMSAIRRQQHACTSTAAVLAHGASCSSTVGVHPSCPSIDTAHANGNCSGKRRSFLTGIAAFNAPRRAGNGNSDRWQWQQRSTEPFVPSSKWLPQGRRSFTMVRWKDQDQATLMAHVLASRAD